MYELSIEQKKKKRHAGIHHTQREWAGRRWGARDEEKDNRWQCKQARTIPHFVKDKTAMCMKCLKKNKKKPRLKCHSVFLLVHLCRKFHIFVSDIAVLLCMHYLRALSICRLWLDDCLSVTHFVIGHISLWVYRSAL